MSWVSTRRSASVLHEPAITISLEKDQRFVIPGCRYGEEVAARKLEKWGHVRDIRQYLAYVLEQSLHIE
jgi:hypothetical protein